MSITLRFDDIIEAKNRTIMLVGAGATGSWFAMMAVKQGYDIIAIDYDTLEPHNVGTSIYPTDFDKGAKKVFLLQRYLYGKVVPIPEKFGEKHLKEWEACVDLIVSAVDNMEARKEIADAAERYMKPLIDMRVHYPYAMIYVVEGKPSLMEKFKETLYGDDEAWQGSCTRQNTPFLSALAASIALKYASFPIRGYTVVSVDVDKMMLAEARE